MRKKKSPRRIPLIVVLIGFVFALACMFWFIYGQARMDNRASLFESITTPLQPKHVSLPLPVRLVIPKMNIDSSIEHVGLTANWAMDTPKSLDHVAWFKLGARPGEKGSAVIAGHYGLEGGKPAVFNTLHTLEQGDKLYIEDEKGNMITFVVRESIIFEENDDTSLVFDSLDDNAHLNLITCEGVWNKDEESYSKRRVVFADKE